MAPPRLGYRKSRAGCLRCKQRRVKCDENRPCRACVRHGVVCSLGVPSSGTSAQTSSSLSRETSPAVSSHSPITWIAEIPRLIQPRRPSSAEASTPLALINTPTPLPAASPLLFEPADTPIASSPDPFPYFAKFSTDRAERGTASWLEDLELLHHFTATTWKTLSQHGVHKLSDMWQVDIPKQGFQNVFVLHQILATSALHLAFLHPAQRAKRALQASHHQSLAIQGIRVALTDITPDNCHALFASSGLFFVSGFAASRPDENTPDGAGPKIDDLVDVFRLLRGIMCVLEASGDLLRSGPLGRMFSHQEEGDGLTVELQQLMTQIEEFLSRARQAGGHSSISDDDNEAIHFASQVQTARERDIVEAAGNHLNRVIAKACAMLKSPEYRIIAEWIIAISDEFITLLRQKNQMALALLSYYCVVLRISERGYWFTRGWSQSVIQDVAAAMTAPWDQDSAWAVSWLASHPIESHPETL
ncbi:hypothetical protein B0T24DRAFT_96748 [Lasiosphaeria ovina]|uniref:Zn(2)-C6 fungal-type domain-containing protein n=1 Tax=Lasiosphaeria ovina TaxID=92902 RepID=A0AAE0JU28_9PEZI|nr:hypothetical protein B0T24DRAFT_96748 [Lasiosphaeria ovina]